MAELVDYNLIQAFQSATAPRQQAMRSFAETLGEGLGDVGSALVGRQMDVKEKRRQLEAYKQALAQEQGQLMSERDRLMQLIESGPMQPYKKVEAQTSLQNIDKRLGEIGSVSDTIPADIGESVRFRTYRDVNPAMLPKRQDAAPDYRDVEMRERQDAAERKAAQDAAEAAKRDEQFAMQFGQKERAIQATIERNKKLDEQRAEQAEAKRNEAIKKAAAPAISNIEAIDYALGIVDQYKDSVPFVSEYAANIYQTERSGAPGSSIVAAGKRKLAGLPEEQDEGVQALLAAIETVAAPIRNKTFGAALSVSDRQLAAQNLPVAGDKEPQLRKKLKILRDLQQKELELIQSGKVDLQKYLAEPASGGVEGQGAPDAVDVESMLQSGEWEIVSE